MCTYGECSNCGSPLEAEWFFEEEYKTYEGRLYKTGRTRYAVDYLICPNCGIKECVDDSFDEPWR